MVVVHWWLRILAENECNKSEYDSALFIIAKFSSS